MIGLFFARTTSEGQPRLSGLNNYLTKQHYKQFDAHLPFTTNSKTAHDPNLHMSNKAPASQNKSNGY
jgi:hypothetical protein